MEAGASNGSAPRTGSDEKVTPVRLNRMELRKIRRAAAAAGYTVESYLAICAFKAASDGEVPDGDAATILAASRDAALTAAALSNRISVAAGDTPMEEAEELCTKLLDLCAMAYQAEQLSCHPSPRPPAGHRRRVAAA